MKCDKILVPTDFSSSSEVALDFAIKLARTTSAALTVVHVHNPTPYEMPDGMPISPIVSVNSVIPEFRKLLERCKAKAEQAGAARVDTLLLQGTAHAEIARTAEQGGYGLIVVGRHGRKGFAHMLQGSVAEKVVREGPCPVITVPMRDKTTKWT